MFYLRDCATNDTKTLRVKYNTVNMIFRHGHQDCVRLLLSRGAELLRTNGGESPLEIAMKVDLNFILRAYLPTASCMYPNNFIWPNFWANTTALLRTYSPVESCMFQNNLTQLLSKTQSLFEYVPTWIYVRIIWQCMEMVFAWFQLILGLVNRGLEWLCDGTKTSLDPRTPLPLFYLARKMHENSFKCLWPDPELILSRLY